MLSALLVPRQARGAPLPCCPLSTLSACHHLLAGGGDSVLMLSLEQEEVLAGFKGARQGRRAALGL